jgi:hypothetical protein
MGSTRSKPSECGGGYHCEPMILALIDYLRFRTGTGRYSTARPSGHIGAGFLGSLSTQTVSILKPGDILFLRGMEDWRSWLVMYLTDSDISHVAWYAGNHRIVHATTGGVVEADLSGLNGRRNLILPLVAPTDTKTRDALIASARSMIGTPYGWATVLRKGWFRISGRYWPGFRLRFMWDLMILLLIPGTLLTLVLHLPRACSVIGSLGIPPWTLLNWARWTRDPVPSGEMVGPAELFVWARRNGFRTVVDGQRAERPAGSDLIAAELHVFVKRESLPTVAQWFAQVTNTPQPSARSTALTWESTSRLGGADGGIEMSIQEALRVAHRFGIDSRVKEYDACVSFRADTEPESWLMLIRAASVLASVAHGLLYNPMGANPFVPAEEAQGWCERNAPVLFLAIRAKEESSLRANPAGRPLQR